MNNIDISCSLLVSQLNVKRQNQLTNVPLPRVELQPSPYGQYTKYQLDMRRKAEILKYKSNKQNSKTNNLTKTQIYVNAVNGYNNIGKSTVDKILNGETTCPNDDLIPTPTSSSDIPGPIIYLINDETVPLYNYVTNPDAYNLRTDTLQNTNENV